MNDTSRSAGKKVEKQTYPALTVEEAIAQFSVMEPAAEVVMRREMEEMFPSICVAMVREVSEGQIMAALRQKWPGTHVATLIKLLNAERTRRLANDEPIACKPFGSPRRPAMRKAIKTTDASDSPRTSQAVSDATNGDQSEVSA